MKKFLFILCALFISLVHSQTIDTQKSEVRFEIKGGGFFKVKGTFTGFSGNFYFNQKDLENSTFDICIDTKTIDSNNKKRDEHLRNEDFFYVEKYPSICFESIVISEKQGGFTTQGKLTILDTTKEVEIPFNFKNNVFTGSLTIDRFDFNLGADYGTFKVGREATVTIKCVVY